MKIRFIALVTFLNLSLMGCATSTYSVGKPFPSENVSQIVKGKTTSQDLIRLFGEPFTKAVLSATDEKWVYMHSEGTSKAQSYIVTMNVETKGTQKMLDILISNGVVTNFAYNDGPNPATIQVN